MADEQADTGVGIFLIPEASDPIVAASSEPAHLTMVWLGDMNDLDEDTIGAIRDEIIAYVDTLDGPVVVPTAERGTLGDDGADVMFLDRTEALLALREGLLEASPTIRRVMDGVEQFPVWTPHVTLGYPETPAAGEYDGDAVTFDRVGLWVGPEQEEYPMSGARSQTASALLAGARAKLGSFDMAGAVADVEPEVAVEDEMPLDELEEDEELITEIPVHGVATLEGRATGDGRGFRPNALSIGAMPQPLGYEYVSTHGGDTSNVAIVGRIDEYWREGVEEGVFELRWRGVIMPGKPYGAQAIESIVDGSYRGLSVIVDSVEVDVTEQREKVREAILAGDVDVDGGGDFDIEAALDEMVGDGKQPTIWYSAARVRRFDMVPTGAFQEGYTDLGDEFLNQLTPEQIEASAQALADCGCVTEVVDLTSLTLDELEEYDALDVEEQEAFVKGRGLASLIATGSVAAFRDYTREERDEMAKDGRALPNGSFPIADVEDLRNAIQGIGRAGDRDAAIAHIKKRAGELDQEDLLPENWSAEAILAAGFAPGTHDGDVGTLISWSVLSTNANETPRSADGAGSITAAGSDTATLSTRGVAIGRLIYSTIDPMMTSAGRGPDTSTGVGMGESRSESGSVSPRTEPSTSAVSAPSPTTASSTTDATTAPTVPAAARANTVDAATLGTSSPSPTPRTSGEGKPTMAVASSAAVGSTTSLTPTPGTSGLSMEFNDGRVVPVTSMDAASGIVMLSDDTVLASGRPLTFSNPSTRDGPGWITHPIPTSRIRRYWVSGPGAAKIAWGAPGDFNRCRAQLVKYVQNPEWLAGLCANMHKEAIGVWPGQEGGGRHGLVAAGSAPAPLVVMASAESARTIYPFHAFTEPRDERAFALRINREARTVEGYAATWDSCHIGISGMCQTPPRSSSNYSFFRKGVVETDAGEQRVALLTMGIGHAGQYDSAAAATAHYDQTDAVRAYINIGENARGIWFAGVLAPWVTDADIDAMRAIGRVSGDWRSWSGRRGDLEMVGLVVVNTEGYQLAASAGIQTAAIGLGALPKDVDAPASVAASAAVIGELETVEFDVDGMAAAVAEKVVEIQDRRELTARVAPARAATTHHALVQARAKFTSLTKE